MAHSLSWARRLLRKRPSDPEELLSHSLLTRSSYADVSFLAVFHPWLDALIFNDPREGLKWAKVAPELALATPAEDGDQAHRESVIRAYVLLGSAYRAAGQPDEADAPYREAFKLAAAGTVSELVLADNDRRLSYLRACQGKAEEALDLAAGAVETLRNVEDDGDQADRIRCLLGEALIALGYVLASELGRYGAAIDAFGEALSLSGVIKGTSAKLYRSVLKRIQGAAAHNLAMAITDSANIGDHRKAMLYIRQAHALAKGKKRSVARYRLLWVEALLWARLGLHAKAEKLHRVALEGFQALQLPWETALVALDLGDLLRLFGEWSKLEELASDAYDQFSVLSGNTEALTALSLWRDAVRVRSLEDEKLRAARQIVTGGIFRGHCCKSRRRR